MEHDGGTLTELGRSQAHALGVRRRDEEFAAIYCSALTRATQTAEVVADLLDLPIQVEPDLREYELGDEPSDLGRLAAVLLGWLNGVLSGQVLGGESGYQVADRIFTVLDEIAERHPNRSVLVVSHGGAILATLGSIINGYTALPTGTPGQLRAEDLPGGTSLVIEKGPGGWRLSSDDAVS